MTASRKIIPSQQIVTSAHKISREANGIIKRQVIEDAHVDVNEIDECEKMSLKLNNGKKMLVLVDASKFHTLTPEATNFLRKIQSKSRIATAIVSSNLSQKIIANFMNDKSGKTPIKTFSTENEAVKWLLSLKRKV
jgi:hypothetical protein